MTHSAQTCHLNTWQGLVPSSASPLPCSQMSLAWENSWLFATPPLVSPGKYRKIPKISPEHILFKGRFWGAYFWRGLSKEGNLRFTIDWANHIVRSKFTVFALFYFVFEGNFPSTSPRGAYIWRGNLTEGFLHYRIGGLIFGGAYTWIGLFSEFYGMTKEWLQKFHTDDVSLLTLIWVVLNSGVIPSVI